MDRNIRNGFLPNRNLLFYSSKSIHIVLLMANILFNVDIGLAAGQCPNACSCFALREVDCTRAELTALPPDLPSDTVKLFMGENSLFGPGSLNGLDPLKSLEVLDLSYSNINQLPGSGAFRGLQSLRILILTSNLLLSLVNNTFTGLTLDELYLNENHLLKSMDVNTFNGSSVKILEMNMCSIEVLYQDVFKPLRDSVTTIRISNNLSPLLIADGTFNGLVLDELIMVKSGISMYGFLAGATVKFLDLSHNPISDQIWRLLGPSTKVNELKIRNISATTIDIISLQDTLTSLDMSLNKLVSIMSKNFMNAPNLMSLIMDNSNLVQLPTDFSLFLNKLVDLSLAGNRLTYLSQKQFKGMFNLENLDISNNQIQTIHKSFVDDFPKLISINLGNNPLHCNCELVWLVQWGHTLLASNTNTEVNTGTCSTPSITSGKQIHTMMSSDFSKCTTPVALLSFSESIVIDKPFGIYCIATGDPPPDIAIILPNDQVIQSRPVTTRRVTEDSKLNVASLQHIIPSYNCSYNGLYKCSATNAAGTVEEKQELNDNCEFSPKEFYFRFEFTLNLLNESTLDDNMTRPIYITKPYVKETDLSHLGYIIALIVITFVLISIVLVFIYYCFRKKAKQSYDIPYLPPMPMSSYNNNGVVPLPPKEPKVFYMYMPPIETWEMQTSM